MKYLVIAGILILTAVVALMANYKQSHQVAEYTPSEWKQTTVEIENKVRPDHYELSKWTPADGGGAEMRAPASKKKK